MNDSKNILVTSFGTSWQIVPELIGYLNHDQYPLYENHPEWHEIKSYLQKNKIPSADELLLVHSDSEQANKAIERVEKWKSNVNFTLPKIQYFSYDGVSDLFDPEECRMMTDLILRTIMYAKEKTYGGKLLLSLAGGRKTMSADIQWGSEIFGCDAMIHIADSIPKDSPLRGQEDLSLFLHPLPEQVSKQLYPMVVFSKKSPHSIITIDKGKDINTKRFRIRPGKNASDISFYEHITKGIKESRNLFFNHYQNLNQNSMQTSFRGLELLEADRIGQLQRQFIASDYSEQKKDIQWLSSLPKAELHCHLGGISDTEGLVHVAKTLKREVDRIRFENHDFSEFLKHVAFCIKNHDHTTLKAMIRQSKNTIRKVAGVSEPYAVAGFLQQFENKSGLLEKLVYGDFTDESVFAGVEFGKYENLGDLQGTGILKHPATLRKTCELLRENCRKDNVRYLELRCSPANYVTKDFQIEEVIKILMDVLADCKHTLFKLIIIASRHKDKQLIESHVNYVVNNLNNDKFIKFFAGFDVAGDEKQKTPGQVKDDLNDLLKQSIQMTIHAGETVAVENVWEAVYELNADRIGHGLTLGEDPRLLSRFVNRRIAVEMCPSSNYQIIGYKDFRFNRTKAMKQYPLMDYFRKGVRVTINTDNPGISRTNLSYEYYKTACMTEGGISKWDILKIIRNGFISAFIPYEQKKNLLLNAEKQLSELL